VPLALLAAGAILATVQLLMNMGSYLSSWFVTVEHPVSYRFATFDRLLKYHVKRDLVDYRGLVHEAPALNRAVKELEHISPDRLAGADERLCFWINAYNLLILKTVADHYPVGSIKEIARSPGLHDFVIGGKAYSPGQIEEEHLRPLLAAVDARALFTVCGGARGYPPLLDHCLEAPALSDDSAAACRRFVNNPDNVYFDRQTYTVYLSPFFRWNADLLSRAAGSPFDFVSRFLEGDKQVDLSDIHVKRRYMANFNWLLNDVALAQAGNAARQQEGHDPRPGAAADAR